MAAAVDELKRKFLTEEDRKYLIETRCSGALTSPYSAMAIEWAA